ncbi:MAG: hypothetical protein H8D23_21680 [Candidatus Brocadiales bacterium]|nr:hypothetical protein [Candidatus Brocadiales bacterium]
MQHQPRSVEAENSVLGAMIEDSSIIGNIHDYLKDGEVFYANCNKMLCQHILNMYSNRETIDAISIVSQMPEKVKKEIGGVTYLSELLEYNVGTSKAVHHAEIVYKKWLQRKIIENSRQIMDIAYEQGTDLNYLIEQSHQYTSEIEALRPGRSFNLKDTVKDTVRDLLDNESLISFGYPIIDQCAGGMTRGEITVVGGRPGHGKTSFVLNLLQKFLAQGLKVVLMNREMPNTEIMKKLIACQSGKLSYRDMRRGEMTVEAMEEIDKTTNHIVTKYSDKLYMFDDIRDIPTAFAEIKKIKPDVVIDDYIQLISVPGKKDRRFEIEYIMNEYKWLAKTSNPKFSVILVSQLNREIEKRIDPIPKLSDLAEGGTIEQTAECVLFAYYEYKVLYNESNIGKFGIQIIAAKVRYGETGMMTLGFNGNRVKFFNNKTEAHIG